MTELRKGLREALVFLRSLSDDLADGVLAGEQPDDVGDADWAAAVEDFAALSATPDPAGPTYTEVERLDRPGNRANGTRAATPDEPVADHVHSHYEAGMTWDDKRGGYVHAAPVAVVEQAFPGGHR